jgi:prepilin-type N-terminal cleavage/methylation domain-containing protein
MTRNNRTGFTLIELLVVIGIIGVLIGILAPALRGARGAALQTVSLANVRSVGQVHAMYAHDHGRHPFRGLGEYPARMRELMPNFEPQPGVALYFWYPRGVVIGTTGHFDQSWLWPSIALELESWPEHWETWVSPRKDRPLPTLEDFSLSDDNPVEEQLSVRYSNAFVARPEFFDPARRGEDPARWDALLRPTRPSDVRFPASKVMLWDNDLAYLTGKPIERVEGQLDAPTPMAFADGHAAVKNPQDASEATDNPLASRGQTMKLADTKDGVAGRDYE